MALFGYSQEIFKKRLALAAHPEASDMQLYSRSQSPHFFYGMSSKDGYCLVFKVGPLDISICIKVKAVTSTSWTIVVDFTFKRSEIDPEVSGTFELDVYREYGSLVVRPVGSGPASSGKTEAEVVMLADVWECIKKCAPSCIPVCYSDPTGTVCLVCVGTSIAWCLIWGDC